MKNLKRRAAKDRKKEGYGSSKQKPRAAGVIISADQRCFCSFPTSAFPFLRSIAALRSLRPKKNPELAARGGEADFSEGKKAR